MEKNTQLIDLLKKGARIDRIARELDITVASAKGRIRRLKNNGHFIVQSDYSHFQLIGK